MILHHLPLTITESKFIIKGHCEGSEKRWTEEKGSRKKDQEAVSPIMAPTDHRKEEVSILFLSCWMSHGWSQGSDCPATRNMSKLNVFFSLHAKEIGHF